MSGNGKVMGRLYWDATHPSPWMSFGNITSYRKWAAAVRKARPGTKTDYVYFDLFWTADSMLRSIQREATADAGIKAAKRPLTPLAAPELWP